jgi:NitT/TauT family transport system substrate-binding protein
MAPVSDVTNALSGTGPRAALPRRALARLAAASALAVPLGTIMRRARAADDLAAPAILTPRTKITFIWNPAALCNVVVGVAKEQGIFDKHGLDVETIFTGGDTASILEALALNKAQATSTFLLRLLKPLEAGFDVKLTSGVHAGCSYLIASRDAGINTLQDLRGKRVGMSDLNSPMKLLYEIQLKKAGIPTEEITWRQYPADVFVIAVQKGEIDAFADGEPNAYYAVKRSNGKLFKLASSGAGELGDYTCCVLSINGKLIRDNRPAAAALTRAMLEASKTVDHDRQIAVRAAVRYSPFQAKPEELDEMIAGYPYDEHRGCPTGEEFRQHVLYFAQGLHETGILRSGTDPVRFTNLITQDVLTG